MSLDSSLIITMWNPQTFEQCNIVNVKEKETQVKNVITIEKPYL